MKIVFFNCFNYFGHINIVDIKEIFTVPTILHTIDVRIQIVASN